MLQEKSERVRRIFFVRHVAPEKTRLEVSEDFEPCETLA